MNEGELENTGKVCPYCGQPSQYLKNSQQVYQGVNYGPVYACLPCEAWVGVHYGTTRSLGSLANAPLRAWRSKLHRLFDPMWKAAVEAGRPKGKARIAAYTWLAGELEIPVNECHVGHFDIPQVKKAIQVVKFWYLERDAEKLFTTNINN